MSVRAKEGGSTKVISNVWTENRRRHSSGHTGSVIMKHTTSKKLFIMEYKKKVRDKSIDTLPFKRLGSVKDIYF